MQRKLCALVTALATVTVIANIAFVVKDSFFYDMENLPEGTFVRYEQNQELLFSQHCRLKVYLVEATDHYSAAVRVELFNIDTRQGRNIYWQTGTESSVIVWNEENIYEVEINGVKVDLRGKGYDCRDTKDKTNA